MVGSLRLCSDLRLQHSGSGRKGVDGRTGQVARNLLSCLVWGGAPATGGGGAGFPGASEPFRIRKRSGARRSLVCVELRFSDEACRGFGNPAFPPSSDLSVCAPHSRLKPGGGEFGGGCGESSGDNADLCWGPAGLELKAARMFLRWCASLANRRSNLRSTYRSRSAVDRITSPGLLGSSLWLACNVRLPRSSFLLRLSLSLSLSLPPSSSSLRLLRVPSSSPSSRLRRRLSRSFPFSSRRLGRSLSPSRRFRELSGSSSGGDGDANANALTCSIIGERNRRWSSVLGLTPPLGGRGCKGADTTASLFLSSDGCLGTYGVRSTPVVSSLPDRGAVSRCGDRVGVLCGSSTATACPPLDWANLKVRRRPPLLFVGAPWAGLVGLGRLDPALNNAIPAVPSEMISRDIVRGISLSRVGDAPGDPVDRLITSTCLSLLPWRVNVSVGGFTFADPSSRSLLGSRSCDVA
eukprot:Hpha_TRINITY_DN13768_c0_g1::TRINITY_DN13768_c0_g1_i1::g.142408::m.142408